MFCFYARLRRGHVDPCIIPEETKEKRSTKWKSVRSNQAVRDEITDVHFCYNFTSLSLLFVGKLYLPGGASPQTAQLDGSSTDFSFFSSSRIEFLVSTITEKILRGGASGAKTQYSRLLCDQLWCQAVTVLPNLVRYSSDHTSNTHGEGSLY